MPCMALNVMQESVFLKSLVLFALIKVSAAGVKLHCKEAVSASVTDCSMHSLRVGYPIVKDSNDTCTTMHDVSSPWGQNLGLARMNKTQPPLQFSTSTHVKVSLNTAAEVYAVGLKVNESTPSSFYVTYQTTTNSREFDMLTKEVNTYSENHKRVLFNLTSGYRKFHFRRPLIVAREFYVHPIPWNGNISIFQLEIFGCFLGALYQPDHFLMSTNVSYQFSFSQHMPAFQIDIAEKDRYLVTFERNTGTSTSRDVLPLNNGPNLMYNITTPGQVSVSLWATYYNRLLRISSANVVSQSDITNAAIHSFSRITLSHPKPYKAVCDNPALVFRVLWDFKDGSTKSSKAGQTVDKTYSEIGFYRIEARLENDFFTTIATKLVHVCGSDMISCCDTHYLTTNDGDTLYNKTHLFVVHVVLNAELRNTTQLDVSLNGTLLKRFNVTRTKKGGVQLGVNLPPMRRLEVNYLNYKGRDGCFNFDRTRKIIALAPLENITLLVTQQFKNATRSSLKDYRMWSDSPLHVHATLSKGDAVTCVFMHVQNTGLAKYYRLDNMPTEHHYGKIIPVPPYPKTVQFRLMCSNPAGSALHTESSWKLLLPLPTALRGMSTTCSPAHAPVNGTTDVKLTIKAGTEFDCVVHFPSAGLQHKQVERHSFLDTKQENPVDHSTTFTLVTGISSPIAGTHAYTVTCTNLRGSMVATNELLVWLPVTGLTVSLSDTLICVEDSVLVNWSVDDGIYPLNLRVTIGDVVILTELNVNATRGNFTVAPGYLSTGGNNTINVTMYNDFSSATALETVAVVPSWKHLDLQFTADFTFARHGTPVTANNIKFSISPNDSNLFEHVVWAVNNQTVATTHGAAQLVYASAGLGAYEISATVVSCWNVTVVRYLSLATTADFSQISNTPQGCGICIGARVSNNLISFVTYGLKKNCVGDLTSQSAIDSTCRVYNLSSNELTVNFTETANYSLARIDTEAGIANIYSTSTQGAIKDCFTPVIKGRGLLSAISTGITTNSLENTLEVFIDFNCPVLDFDVMWTVSYLGNNRSRLHHTRQELPIDSFNKSGEFLVIPPYTLSSGFYLVTVNAVLRRAENVGGSAASKDFYLNVTSREPIAFIENGTTGSALFPREYVLNGSKSRDPDQPINSSVSLTYSWICRDLSSPTIDPTDLGSIQAQLPSIDYNAAPPNSLGCFGHAQGVLSRAKMFTISSAKLRENVTYEIILVVSKSDVFGVKSAYFTQQIFVDFAERPWLQITCNENCLSKINPNGRLSLTGTCEGDGCIKPVFYLWKLYQIINYMEVHVPLMLNQTSCGFERTTFILKASVLQPGKNYSLLFQGSRLSGVSGEAKYHLFVNNITVHGNCSVYPKEGLVLVTSFKGHCSGWSDVDGPLTYSFFAISNYLTIQLCHGENATCNTKLQVEPSNGFYTRVKIVISDPLKATTRLELSTKVSVPRLSLTMISNAIADLSSSVSMAQNSSRDVQVSIQKLSAVTSMLNYLSNMFANGNASIDVKPIDVVKFRDHAVDDMLRLNLPRESRLSVIAPIAASLCSVPCEVSCQSASKIAAALSDMQRTIAGEYENMEFDDVVKRANNFMIATGAVTKASSLNGAGDKTSNATALQKSTNWKKEEAVHINKVLMNSTGSFHRILLSKLIPGEDPLVIDSDSLKTLIAKKAISDENELVTTNVANAEVILPKLDNLGPGLNNQSLDISMQVSNFNLFFWSNSSKDVKTDVLDFNIVGSKVENASEDINMLIKRPNNDEPPWTRNKFKDSTFFNQHKVVLKKGHSLHMEIRPYNACTPMHVYMKYQIRPTLKDYDLKWSVPDFSGCSSVTTNASSTVSNTSSHLHEEMCFMYKNLTNRMNMSASSDASSCFKDELLLGEQLASLVNCTAGRNQFQIFIPNTELKEGIYYIGITPAHPVKQTFSTTAKKEMTNSNCSLTNPSPGYFMLVYTASCIYWNETNGWINNGCKVGARTTWNFTHCRCNHLTSFASDFLIAPNPIDMDKVLEGFTNLKDNLSVFIFIIVLIAAYILVLVFMRKRDRTDREKLGVSVIAPFHFSHRYLIVFVTGARTGAGTTANVYVVLNGEKRKSDVTVLKDSSRPVFNRDQINAFEVSFEEELGELQTLQVWHDNTGSDPSWYISHVYVENLQTKQRYKFFCARWLAVDEGDGQIEATLGRSDESEFVNFSHLFTTKVARKCSDEHLWLSVALNRPHSTFTRVQRVTCCLCLLVTTMLTSAMFFSFDGDEAKSGKFVLRVGSLEIDFRGIIIGIQAGLIAIPANTIILYLFRNSKPFKARKSSAEELSVGKDSPQKKYPDVESGKEIESCAKSDIEKFDDKYLKKQMTVEDSPVYHIKIDDHGNAEILRLKDCDLEDRPDHANESNTGIDESNAYKGRLPHFCLYIAWFLSFCVVVSSLLVILFYSMMWGNAKSKQWLLSVFTGFFQSMFVVQPFKLLVVSVIAAAILKMPENEDEVLDAYITAQRHKSKEQQIRSSEEIEMQRVEVKKLTERERLKARSVRLMEVRLRRFLRDITLYVIFLVFLFLIARGYRDPTSYSFSQASGITGSGFKSISDINSAWDWIQNELIPGLYRRETSGAAMVINKMTPDQASYLVGTVRLRQIRIKPGTCTFPKDAVKSGLADNRTCNDYFSLLNQDESRYDVGWKPRLKNRNRRSAPVTDECPCPPTTAYSQALPHSNSKNNTNARRKRRALRSGSFDIEDSSTTTIDHTTHAHTFDLVSLMANGKITTRPGDWMYKGMMDLKGFPYIGQFAMYSGGGYASNLGSDFTEARLNCISLRYYNWLDHLTRALFAEFSIYNPNSNLFGTAFVFVEILPHGGAVPSGSTIVFRLYQHIGPRGKLVMASEILLVLLFLCFIYRDMRRMYQQGLKYFKQFWNIVDTTITISVFATLILWFSRWYQGDNNLLQLRKDPTAYVGFQYTAAADEAMVTCLGFIVFFSVLKLIPFLQFFPMILQLTHALKQIRGPMLGFALPFVVSFTAFAVMAFLIFGANVESFSSFMRTIVTQFLMLLGGSTYELVKEYDAVLGPIYFTLFVICQVFFVFNLLIATLNETVCGKPELSREDEAFIEYMITRLQRTVSRLWESKTSRESLSENEALSKRPQIRRCGARELELMTNTEFETHLKELGASLDKLCNLATNLEQENKVDDMLMEVIANLCHK